jgi:hypothetical protein
MEDAGGMLWAKKHGPSYACETPRLSAQKRLANQGEEKERERERTAAKQQHIGSLL